MSLTDKDAQRRPWVMAKDDHAESFWQGPYRLLAAPPNAFSCTVLTVDRTVRFFDECRECTPEELAKHGLTQPPRPWAERVRQWAKDRNIIGGTTPKDQFGKLVEEVKELRDAMEEYDLPDIVDAIGDCSVVLAIIAAQYGLAVEQCQEAAWGEIKDRKGRIENGTFVKEVSE